MISQGLAILVLLMAAALRVYRLDGQSLWSDEGASVVMAGRSVAEIAARAAGDIHPPLYYVLLHWWSLGAGQSAFALRYGSVLVGLIVVALVYGLGCRLAGQMAGLIAAALAAGSPLLVYYSQEMRMYMLMTTFTSAATVCFLRLSEPGRARRWWVGYVFTAAAALYSQYFAVTILAFHNLVVAGALICWGSAVGGRGA
ncbi:MAG: glycosyltransferase family 39 protein, partial [Chloroflexi bacterium]|nr:glycosyltransferase family 39 protein [Chloroflexota bacterium]